MVARGEFAAPLGIELLGRPLTWNAHLAYVRYLGRDQDVLGFVDYVEVGAGIAAAVGDGALPVDRVALAVAAIVGEDVRGFSIGLGVTF